MPKSSVPIGSLASDSYQYADEGAGLLASLYDFRFESLVTPRLVRAGYATFVVVLTLASTGFAGYLLSKKAYGLAASVAIWYVILLFSARLAAEFAIHEFLTALDVRVIRREVTLLRQDAVGGISNEGDNLSPGMVVKRALASADTRNDRESINLLTEAISVDPTNSELYALRAEKLERLGRLEDAIVDLDRAIELIPDEDTYFGMRADLKQRLGDKDGAIADYDSALALRPRDRDYTLGRELSVRGYNAALEAALSVLADTPDARLVCVRCRETYTRTPQGGACLDCDGDLVDETGQRQN